MTTGQRIVNWGRHTEEEDEKKTLITTLFLFVSLLSFSQKKKSKFWCFRVRLTYGRRKVMGGRARGHETTGIVEVAH